MARSTYYYRAYHLTCDGHILHAEIFSGESDADALRKLAATANAHGIELWDRARLVGRVDAYDPRMMTKVESAA